MNKTGYHATRNIGGIQADGIVRPARLDSVYLFSSVVDAHNYAKEFRYPHVVTVEYESHDVKRTWKPAYCTYGRVVKLIPGRTCKYVPGLLASLVKLATRLQTPTAEQ